MHIPEEVYYVNTSNKKTQQAISFKLPFITHTSQRDCLIDISAVSSIDNVSYLDVRSCLCWTL